MEIRFDRSVTQNFDIATRKEWLETNGLGGWASSTIIGVHTRRYHGLLVAATDPPLGRMVLLSKLDETVYAGGHAVELGCNRYPDAIHPEGYRYLQSFKKGLFPQFEYRIGNTVLRKTIAAIHGENTTLIIYEILQARSPFIMKLTPLFAARDYHSLSRFNDHISREASYADGILAMRPYPGVPMTFISVPGSTFEAKKDWYFDFEFGMEKNRGLDFREDLFSYGAFRVHMEEGSRLGVIVSTSSPEGRDALHIFGEEKNRRDKLFISMDKHDGISRILALAADQFIVRRGEDIGTIIAGYHWFGDWGRDTMIALPGLCLATGRYDDGKKILRSFARTVSRGMLPNRFPDSGEDPEYNTADASLWYFVSIYKYFQHTRDWLFVRDELMPLLRDIIDWHDRGTRYNIHTDQDGLLYAGEPGMQLTWMDAKIGNSVVTPRQGKAVEINALWHNALAIYGELSATIGDREEGDIFRGRSRRVKEQFVKMFWNDGGGYLYDFIDGEYRSDAIRPNQIFALSLPFPLIEGEKARKVLKIIEKHLYTPFGLRSLAPGDPDFCPWYGGDQPSRDRSYHQGTAWGWLLGPLITAIVRIEGSAGKKRSLEIVERALENIDDAGIGTISEIFDGEAPHSPRGCIAQAWSVAEILRAYREDILG